MFDHIFLSAQVKRNKVISNKHVICDLPNKLKLKIFTPDIINNNHGLYKLPHQFKLWVLGN